MFYEYNNTISFSIEARRPLLEGLQESFFPEFSVYGHDPQDHLPDIYRVRSSLLSDSDCEEITKSKVKTLCQLFRGALFLLNEDYAPSLCKQCEIFLLGKKITLINNYEVPFTDEFVLPIYDDNTFQIIDLRSSLNIYLYLALRDVEFLRCLLFASDRFDYIDMYRIKEVINSTNEKSVLRPFETELDKFTCSANNFTATGFASRHGTGSKDDGVKKRFISLTDSRALFMKIIADFAYERAKKIHIEVDKISIPEKIAWDIEY